MNPDDQTQPTNGANGPGAGMTPAHGVLLVLLAAGSGLLFLGFLTR
jgi:hypothetical protein